MSAASDENLLNDLAGRFGISPDYHDIWGQQHFISRETKRAILQAMGVAAVTREELVRALAVHNDAPWRKACDPVLIVKQAALIGRETRRPSWSFRMPAVPEEEREIQVLWEIWDETGTLRHNGHAGPGLTPVESRELAGRRHVRFELPIPDDLGLGYYDLKACSMGRSTAAEGSLRLIVVPDRCYLPSRFTDSPGVWGLSVQLYALRSARNWGVGDFGDLVRLQDWAAQELGADILGLNPLHALRNTKPYHISPYSPESRLYLNVLYLDLERIPEFQESQAAQDIVQEPGFCYRLESLRRSDLVEYEEVWALKRKVLEALFQTFRDQHLRSATPLLAKTPRGEAFLRYVKEAGPTLEQFAVFQVLSEYLRRDRPSLWMWREWPEMYRTPGSPAVVEFCRTHGEQILFQQYLQWVTHEQVREVSDRGRSLGMTIGLYHDLALGSDRAGSDAWIFQHVLALDADCGAPPDAFAPEGQNWGLPPIDPQRLRAAAYQPFVELLRKNLQHGGALRLDHVMALFRLFWIPRGLPTSAGAYVQYPTEDLLSILALESVRHQVIIVGEDLGTVPDHVREQLARYGVLSYRVFYFERDGQVWIPPQAYPQQALAVVTTHDLPTLAGFWKAEDIQVRARLGFYPDEDAQRRALQERDGDKAGVLAALKSEGLLPSGLNVDLSALPEMTTELCQAIHAYLARTSSWIVLVALEDVLGETAQANVPGTLDSYPNWSRKLAVSVEQLRQDPRPRQLAAVLRPLRSSSHGVMIRP